MSVKIHVYEVFDEVKHIIALLSFVSGVFIIVMTFMIRTEAIPTVDSVKNPVQYLIGFSLLLFGIWLRFKKSKIEIPTSEKSIKLLEELGFKLKPMVGGVSTVVHGYRDDIYIRQTYLMGRRSATLTLQFASPCITDYKGVYDIESKLGKVRIKHPDDGDILSIDLLKNILKDYNTKLLLFFDNNNIVCQTKATISSYEELKNYILDSVEIFIKIRDKLRNQFPQQKLKSFDGAKIVNEALGEIATVRHVAEISVFLGVILLFISILYKYSSIELYSKLSTIIMFYFILALGLIFILIGIFLIIKKRESHANLLR